MSLFERIRRGAHAVEDAVLTGLLLAMILLAAAQIFLRNLFGAGFVWGDVLVRVLVLWVGLLGAMVAGRKGDHIRIDLAGRFLSPPWDRAARLATDLFTAAVCSVVFFFSAKFVRWEYIDGMVAFGVVPAWVCESIIPLAFLAMALRYFARVFRESRSLLGRNR